jgi:hypothetical protein
LPGKERELIFSKLEFVHLPTRSILNEMGASIEFGYFMNSGLASILNVMSDGKSVEVGITGKEGFVGLPLVVGFETSPTRAVMQISGTGFRINSKDFEGCRFGVARMPNAGKTSASLFARVGIAGPSAGRLQPAS